MIHRLYLAAQGTLAISCTMTSINLSIGGESTFGHLPEEDFNFQRKFSTPKEHLMREARALVNLTVQVGYQNLPLLSRPQDTESGSWMILKELVSRTREAQRSRSSGPKERRNWSELGETGRAWATEMFLVAQISKSLGNLIAAIRRDGWANVPLNFKQVKYAALDACVGFDIARKCYQLAGYNTHVDRLNVSLLE
jgi:hypothetical protein